MNESAFFYTQNLCKILNGSLIIRHPGINDPMPIIRKQHVDLNDLRYTGFQNIRRNDDASAARKTVGFFLKDRKFEHVCYKPWQYTERLRQYAQVMSPDLSCYTDMPIDEQRFNIYLSRLTGAFWQSAGLKVIPSITWGNSKSYDFAFSGVDIGSVVAVSTIGTYVNYRKFMEGFIEMCRLIRPPTVICYCKPHSEMHKHTNILSVEYEGSKYRRAAKYRPIPGQLLLFDWEEVA